MSAAARPALARTGRRIRAPAVAAVAAPALLLGAIDAVDTLAAVATSRAAAEEWRSGPSDLRDDPLADLHRNLLHSDDVPVIRYAPWSDHEAYLRAAVYDGFDGHRWSPAGGRIFGRVQVGLPDPPGRSATELTLLGFDITVTDDYPWRSLPVPYPTRYVTIEGEWYYDAATLDVVSPEADPRGMSYHVEAVDVQVDPARLRAAPEPGADLDPMRDLPAGLGDALGRYLDEAAGTAGTGFDRALALQSWLRRGGGFVVDRDVADAGSSAEAVLAFLRDRRGHSEQYAAAMAVLARGLGIPARVAVGFRPGERQTDGSYVVTAHDAHAWPELYFEGTGWIPFQPTPPDPDRDDDDAAALWNLSDDGARASRWLGAAVAALVAVVLGLRAASSWHRHRRRWRRAAGVPALEAEAAWADLRLTAIDLGLARSAVASPRATARHLVAVVDLDPESRRLLDEVVRAVEQARYGPRVDPVPTLERDAARLRRSLIRSRSLPRRVVVRLWPATAPRPAG